METTTVNEKVTTAEDAAKQPFDECKAPGVFIKLYERTSKDGKPAVYGRMARRRQVGEQWEDNPWINSMSDLDAIIEVCLHAKQKMRDFYSARDT